MSAVYSNIWVTPDANKYSKSLRLAYAEIESSSYSKCLESISAFHKGRLLEITVTDGPFLSITKEEIEGSLSLEVEELQFNKNYKSAYVTLKKPECLDPLITTNEKFLPVAWKENIKTRLSSSENFLCISNLPDDLDSEEFQELVDRFGPTNNSFVLREHNSGKSLGCGFVEYCSRAVACQAKGLLDKNEFRSQFLQCDWLNHKIVSYTDLYPKCLLIYGLPQDIVDLTSLRKIFSAVAQPLYCQIIMKQGKYQGTALVEFQTHKEAADTKTILGAQEINGGQLRITYTQPGKSAVKIYENLMSRLFNESQTLNKATSFAPAFPSIPFQLQLGCFGNTITALQTLYNCLQPQNPNLSNLGLPVTNNHANMCNNPFSLPTIFPSLIKKEENEGQESLSEEPTTFQPAKSSWDSLTIKNKTGGNEESTKEVAKLNFDEVSKDGILGSFDYRIPQDVSPIIKTSPCHPRWSPLVLTTPPSWKNFRFQNITVTPPILTGNKDCSPTILHGFQKVKIETVENTENILKDSQTPKKGLVISRKTPVKKVKRKGVTWAKWSSPLWNSSEQTLARGIMATANLWSDESQESMCEATPAGSPDSKSLCTPVDSLKRKPLSLLPQPEPSPVNDYIGQHSQGIGGHYAESYRLKKRRLI